MWAGHKSGGLAWCAKQLDLLLDRASQEICLNIYFFRLQRGQGEKLVSEGRGVWFYNKQPVFFNVVVLFSQQPALHEKYGCSSYC